MERVTSDELHRLGFSLSLPITHTGRRTAKVSLSSPSALRVVEDVELLVPRLPGESDSAVKPRVVSAGLFNKSFRLPDLQASVSGSRVAVYARNDREKILSALFLGQFGYERGLESGIYPTQAHADLYAPSKRLDPEELRELISRVARIHGAPPKAARAELRELQRWLQERGLGWLAWKHEFAHELSQLCDETQLLVEVRASPAETLVLHLEYTTPASAANSRLEFQLGDRPPIRLLTLPRVALRFLGLTPWAARLETPPADHCESFHIIVSAEEGMSVEDVYFEEFPRTGGSIREAETRFQRGRSVWLARRWDDGPAGSRRVKPIVWFGIHPLTKQTAFIAFILSSLASYVLWKVAQSPSTLEDNGARSFLVTLPGVLTAALAQTKGASRVGHGLGPRGMLYTVAAIPFLVAVAQLFGGPPNPADLARYGAAFSSVVGGIFFAAWVARRTPPGGERFTSVAKRRRFYRFRDVVASGFLLLAVGLGVVTYSTAEPMSIDTSDVAEPSEP